MEWTKAQLAHLDKVLKTTSWTKKDWLRFRRLNAKSPFTGIAGKKYPGGRYVTKNRNLNISETWELQDFDPEITEACKGILKPQTFSVRYNNARIIRELSQEAK